MKSKEEKQLGLGDYCKTRITKRIAKIENENKFELQCFFSLFPDEIMLSQNAQSAQTRSSLCYKIETKCT